MQTVVAQTSSNTQAENDSTRSFSSDRESRLDRTEGDERKTTLTQKQRLIDSPSRWPDHFLLLNKIVVTAAILLVWGIAGVANGNEGAGIPEFAEIFRPLNKTKFPKNTRAVSIIGVKPIGMAIGIDIEDPNGNATWLLQPAIKPFFSPVFDRGGQPLLPGEYEVTIYDMLDPGTALDQTSFTIAAEGDDLEALPSLDTPEEGATFAANVPYIVFSGVIGEGAPVFLELYNTENKKRIYRAHITSGVGNIWGYVLRWDFGAGKFKAVVYPADPEIIQCKASDSHRFEVLPADKGLWPIPPIRTDK